MTDPRVPMSHPETKAEISVPPRSVKIYEASGWVQDNKPEAAVETPAAPVTPAPETGSKAGNSRAAGKEESK